MKPLIIIVASFLLVTSNVYICDSKGAKVYHSTKNCKGLTNCTHTIKEVAKDDAINKYARRACKICY